jgi:catechol 2,3-dioxygenase-like lactoylglutathione lyase family enzyme
MVLRNPQLNLYPPLGHVESFMAIEAKYVHTNIIAKDWQKLSQFCIDILGCKIVPPERQLRRTDVERGTGIVGSELHGNHLRLPGYGESGPTLEIFSYTKRADEIPKLVNRPGFAHIAVSVNDVKNSRKEILNAGGKSIGDIVTLQISSGSKVTWCYVTDPEGNIIELQSWSK